MSVDLGGCKSQRLICILYCLSRGFIRSSPRNIVLVTLDGVRYQDTYSAYCELSNLGCHIIILNNIGYD